MSLYELHLKKEGYDPFLDYLKGICIIWVVMTHAISKEIHDYSLFCLWGDMAVPIFLLIQCIHIYKKDKKPEAPDFKKMWVRIIKPFLYVQVILFVLGAICSITLNYYENIYCFTYNFIIEGGWGKGGYYPKMYIEFAFLIPLFYPLLQKSTTEGGGIILLICIVSELFFSITDYYKLWQWFCFRYLFIIALGYKISKDGIILNHITIAISMMSLLLILLFQYGNFDFQPVFYNNPWRIFHWPVYVYVTYILVLLLYRMFFINALSLNSLIIKIGSLSYEIFLFQMIVYFISDRGMESIFTNHLKIPSPLYFIMLFFASILPVILYKYIKQKRLYGSI